MLFQKNPLTMVGMLSRCWLFTYHTPVQAVRSLLPQQLEPVTQHGSAFWNIVVCRIQAMRPKHFPAFSGVSYWHAAYRLYARFRRADGESIEGLYFVRSECDNRLMALAGNLLTDFQFHTASMRIEEHNSVLDIRLDSPDAQAFARLLPVAEVQLAPHSAFSSLEEAAAFLKYKPYGLSVDRGGHVNVVHITRQEDAWKSRLVRVESAHWSFFADQEVAPEICYEVEPIMYQWDRGRIYHARC